MKRTISLLVAVLLVALGAIVGHLLTISQSQPLASADKPATVTTPSNITTSYHASTSPQVTNVSASAIDAATERAYAAASASVVYVDNLKTGTGSGIIYDTRGDIVTNYHVVDGTTTQRVTLNDGRQFTAHVVGTDAADDLAVIRIQASNLKPATFASAGSFHIAQSVLAIGSPLGLKQSVTFGLISGLDRVEQEPNGAYLPNAIQTSAPINPGNSGGALVTLDGTVVGMPTLEQTSSQDGTSAQSIGFAIPSTRITAVANQIIATGKVQHTGRAYLGISPTDATSQSPFGGQGGNQSPFGGQWPFGGQGQGGGQSVTGAAVSNVASNGPAAQAGVQVGDVITSANGTTVSSAQDLLAVLAKEKPGDTITLKINRNGSTQTVQVHLGELPA
jgi:S1-C subfamily serine protease